VVWGPGEKNPRLPDLVKKENKGVRPLYDPLVPNDLRPVVNLANVAREAGEHGESRRLYGALLERLPDHPVIRRNALVSLEYDPEVPDTERIAQARAWGNWAIGKTARIKGSDPYIPRHWLSPIKNMQLILVFLIVFFTGLCYPAIQRSIHEQAGQADKAISCASR